MRHRFTIRRHVMMRRCFMMRHRITMRRHVMLCNRVVMRRRVTTRCDDALELSGTMTDDV